MKDIKGLETMQIGEEFLKVTENSITSEMVFQSILESGEREEAFYIMNIADVARKHELWNLMFPTVKPFYAVKCNDSAVVLSALNALGVSGFDCASKAEIEKVLSLGVSPDRIIFANPIKLSSHLKYAYKVGVNLMTFDNETELKMIQRFHPKAKLVLRIRYDAKVAQCPLGMKFGAEEKSIKSLISRAIELGLTLVGVSFHVGSGCKDLSAFANGVIAGCNALEEMVNQGVSPYILDIGGGFEEVSFAEVTMSVNKALANVPSGVTVIAEPGRFYVDSAYTLATMIHGIRGNEYYINDGVYGSFNCVLYDHATPTPKPLKEINGPLIPHKIWGPTCDSLDLVTEDVLLPKLEIGDWLIWEKMGAYTLPSASTFNGFPIPSVFYVATEGVWNYLAEAVGIDEEALLSVYCADKEILKTNVNFKITT